VSVTYVADRVLIIAPGPAQGEGCLSDHRKKSGWRIRRRLTRLTVAAETQEDFLFQSRLEPLSRFVAGVIVAVRSTTNMLRNRDGHAPGAISKARFAPWTHSGCSAACMRQACLSGSRTS
jgi:hypothetical protein